MASRPRGKGWGWAQEPLTLSPDHSFSEVYSVSNEQEEPRLAACPHHRPFIFGII